VADLVVITGPIGSGKSTVALLLAERYAAAGWTVANADLDEVAFTQRSETPDYWRRAGVAYTGLVRGWFEAGCEAVICHGPFFEAECYGPLFASAPTGGRVRHVRLSVRFEVALARVLADSQRPPTALSKNPDFLRSTHEVFRAKEPTLPPADLTIETSTISAASVAGRIADLLIGSEGDAAERG
jgi:RecA/RadA recombinase